MTCRILEALALFLLLLIGLQESVAAINCFYCNYSSNTIEETSTCGGVSSSASADLNCSGTLCRTVWTEYSSPSNTYRVQECTNSSSDAPPIEHCQGATIGNKTYFVHQNQCCSTTGEVFNYGTMYRISECYCQTDYCNGVTNLPISSAVTTTVNYLTSSNQPISYSFITGQSGNSPTTVVHEIVTTSRAALQRNAGNRGFSTTHWIPFISITVVSVVQLL